MDANTIITLVGSLGFPIVACIACGWYCKYQSDIYRVEVKEIQVEHKQEINKVTEALNNNTLALQKLVDKLEKEA